MFKNKIHDPLAVPESYGRHSQGPTTRRIGNYVRVGTITTEEPDEAFYEEPEEVPLHRPDMAHGDNHEAARYGADAVSGNGTGGFNPGMKIDTSNIAVAQPQTDGAWQGTGPSAPTPSSDLSIGNAAAGTTARRYYADDSGAGTYENTMSNMIGEGSMPSHPSGGVVDPTGGLLGETAQPGVHPLPTPGQVVDPNATPRGGGGPSGGGMSISMPSLSTPPSGPAGGPAGPSNATAAPAMSGASSGGGGLTSPSMIDKASARIIDASARQWMASGEADCDDRSEVLYRARRYAHAQTSTWSPQASQRAAAVFCARVDELIPKRRKQAAAPVTHIADFDDQLLYY